MAKLLPLLAAPLDRARRPVTGADAPAYPAHARAPPSDPANRAGAAIPLAFVALEDLQRQGPFAAIFTAAEHPTQPVDWLGQPHPETGEADASRAITKSTPRPRRPTAAASTRRTRASSGQCSAPRVAICRSRCGLARSAQASGSARTVRARVNRHPAKMLPEIARRVIAAYSEPGDLALDPMCGIATTLVEAIHLERRAIGVELEGRWASLAAKNIDTPQSRRDREGSDSEGRRWHLGRGVLDELAGRCR